MTKRSRREKAIIREEKKKKLERKRLREHKKPSKKYKKSKQKRIEKIDKREELDELPFVLESDISPKGILEEKEESKMIDFVGVADGDVCRNNVFLGLGNKQICPMNENCIVFMHTDITRRGCLHFCAYVILVRILMFELDIEKVLDDFMAENFRILKKNNFVMHLFVGEEDKMVMIPHEDCRNVLSGLLYDTLSNGVKYKDKHGKTRVLYSPGYFKKR